MHRENDNSTIKISYFFLYSIAAYKMKKNDIKIKKNLNSPNLNELIDFLKNVNMTKTRFAKTRGKTFQSSLSVSCNRMRQSVNWCRCILIKIHQRHCYSKTLSYVLTKLEHVPSQMRKTTKLTTPEKWPKNLWKRVPLHTPMQWHGTPGNRLKRKHQTCMAMIRYYNIDFSKKNFTGAPNENRVQNRLNIALLNVF